MPKPTKPTNPSPQTVYVYQGKDLGIPGLPHEVTRAQAQALGLIQHLEAAIKCGIYTARKGGTSQAQEPVSVETPAVQDMEA